MEDQQMRNALATHVLDVGQSHKEVFLNLSFWGNNTDNLDPVLETIKTLSEWKDRLASVICDHTFVLNSTEQTKCQLGCTHYNLNDKEALLADMKPESDFKVTFEDVKETYSRFLSDQIGLATTYMKRLLPDIRQDDPNYDEFRRWYFVFQDEMDHIKYEVQKGLQRLKKDQPYRKKYQVAFGYKSDIPNLYTDDLFAAEAVYKEYQSRGVKCNLGILTHEKKDSTSINYYPLEQDVDRRLKCYACKERLVPGDRTVIAEISEPIDDYPRREVFVHNHGEVMHAKCYKKITDKDKEFHRTVRVHFSEEEMLGFSHYRDDGSIRDVTYAMRQRWYDFRRMEITSVRNHGDSYGKYHVSIKGLGHQFDELKQYLKPSTKKETK